MNEKRRAPRLLTVGLVGAVGATLLTGCTRHNNTPTADEQLQTTIASHAHNLGLLILSRRGAGVVEGSDASTPPAATRTINLALSEMGIPSGTVTLLVHAKRLNPDGTFDFTTLDNVSAVEWGPSQGTRTEDTKNDQGQWTVHSCLTAANSSLCQSDTDLGSNVTVNPSGEAAGLGYTVGNHGGAAAEAKIDAVAQRIAGMIPQDRFTQYGLPGAQ